MALIASIAAAALATFGFWRLARGRWGEAMRAVRDAERRRESIGLNPVAIKARGLRASRRSAPASPAPSSPRCRASSRRSTFAFSQSILFVLVVIIGGAGSVAGPLVGAAIVVLLPEVLAGLAEYRLLFFGALLLVVLWIAPDGVVGADCAGPYQRSGAGTHATRAQLPPAPRPAPASRSRDWQSGSAACGRRTRCPSRPRPGR